MESLTAYTRTSPPFEEVIPNQLIAVGALRRKGTEFSTGDRIEWKSKTGEKTIALILGITRELRVRTWQTKVIIFDRSKTQDSPRLHRRN